MPPFYAGLLCGSPSTMERQVVRFSRVKRLSPPSLYHASDRRTALDSAELGSGGFCTPRLRRLPRWSCLGAPPPLPFARWLQMAELFDAPHQRRYGLGGHGHGIDGHWQTFFRRCCSEIGSVVGDIIIRPFSTKILGNCGAKRRIGAKRKQGYGHGA